MAGSWTGSCCIRSCSGITLTSEGSYPPDTVAGLETNTLWNGLFHASTWVAVSVGLYLLWRRSSKWRWALSGRALIGWMLVGWGLFNLVEGIVDHHLLTVHHVREGENELAYTSASSSSARCSAFSAGCSRAPPTTPQRSSQRPPAGLSAGNAEVPNVVLAIGRSERSSL